MARPPSALRALRPPCLKGATRSRKEAEAGIAALRGRQIPASLTPTPRAAAAGPAGAIAPQEAPTATKRVDARVQTRPAYAPPPIEEAHRKTGAPRRPPQPSIGRAAASRRVSLITIRFDVVIPPLRLKLRRGATDARFRGPPKVDSPAKAEPAPPSPSRTVASRSAPGTPTAAPTATAPPASVSPAAQASATSTAA